MLDSKGIVWLPFGVILAVAMTVPGAPYSVFDETSSAHEDRSGAIGDSIRPMGHGWPAAPLPGQVAALSDDFDDGAIDLEKWVVGAPTAQETNGRLEFPYRLSANGESLEGGGALTSRRPLFGDFDVRIDFILVVYPVENTMGEIVELAPDTIVWRTNGHGGGIVVSERSQGYPAVAVARCALPWEECYQAGYNDNYIYPGYGTRDREGSLRLQRIGSVITAYRAHEEFWVEDRSDNVTSEPLFLTIRSWIDCCAQFRPAQIRVAFDNLVVKEALRLAVSAEPTSGASPLEVNFTSTVTGGRLPYSYAWTFGDGGTSPQANPIHEYRSVGTHMAELTVTDAEGRMISRSIEVTVENGPVDSGVGTRGFGDIGWLLYAVPAATGVAALTGLLRRRRRRSRTRPPAT